MSIHHIKTPPGFKTKNASFAFGPGFGAEWSARCNAAQAAVDAAVLRYCADLVPVDTGALAQSGHAATTVGSGVVAYGAPYARRVYHSLSAAGGGTQRGGYWFERMKAGHTGDILGSAGRVL